MDQNNQNHVGGLENSVVGSIGKDFTIVGKHRVHSWYAWAIVGIVFGMALGIVYVANRSNRFESSSASQYAPSTAMVDLPAPIGSFELGSDGNERYSISVIPLSKIYDERMESYKYFLINPVTGLKVEFNQADKKVKVSGKDFAINLGSMRATAVNQPIEGKTVVMSSVQGSNPPTGGTKWISVRNTSRTGSKIVDGQKITFIENLTIASTASKVVMLLETTKVSSLIVKIGETEILNQKLGAKQGVNLQINPDYLKIGNNELRFILTQQDGNKSASESPFGLNYKIWVTGNLVISTPTDNVPPVTPPTTTPTTTAPSGEVPTGSRPTPVSPTLNVTAVKIATVQKLIPSASNIELLRFKMTADNAGDVIIKSITVTDSISGGVASESFTGYALWENNQRVAVPLSAPIFNQNSSRINFEFDRKFTVSKGQSKTLIVRASILPEPVIGSKHNFSIDSFNDIGATGKNYEQIIINAGAPGQTLEIEPVKISYFAIPTTPTTNHVRLPVDDVAGLTFVGSSLASASMKQVTLTLYGTAIGAPFTVYLTTIQGVQIGASQVCTADASGNCTVTFSPNISIGKNQTVNLKVAVSSSNFDNSADVAETLVVGIAKSSDVVLSGGGVTTINNTTARAKITYQ